MSKQNYNNLHLSVAILALLILGGCVSKPVASSGSEAPVYELVEQPVKSSIHYKIQANDRLGDIAQEFTGSSRNWRKIAEHNGITNPRLLKVGTVLEIPGYLLPSNENATPISGASFDNKRNDAASYQTSSALALQQSSTKPENDVVITPIQTNRNFELNPFKNEAQSSVNHSSVTTGNERYIKVVGSYYPKGVYAQPAAYSKLLLRVAPGTQFVLDRQVNEWFKITTENGTGYIRMSDAELL